MRYGNPSIASALAKLKAARCDRILLLPMYPQYAASTTATACDAVFKALMQDRSMPALRTIASWHDDPAYIKALAAAPCQWLLEAARPAGQADHELSRRPKIYFDKGDPCHCLCQRRRVCWPASST